ncbi:MAG: hypothetical protein KDA24_18575 [Deltaproteobacteria bacterium]|nr:hypothetical protein [Deltaproteobacteria bacterium]
MPRYSLLLLAAIPLAGCPSDGGEGSAPPDTHAWYEGTVTSTKPDGDPLGDPSVSLLRRSTLPGSERIEEQWVEIDDGGVAFDVIVSLTVVAEDGTYRAQYQDEFGVLEGVGALTRGDDWAWTAWESQIEYTSGPITGTSLQTVAEVAGGTLSMDTDVIGADSTLEVIEVRELEAISEATFDARYAELIGG